MGVRRVEDLIAFQLATEFKNEVYRLLDSCTNRIDFKYRSQLSSAVEDVASDVAEGFARNVTGEFVQFLRYAAASLAEAQRRLEDGVRRKYFSQADCTPALRLAARCVAVIRALQRSLEPFRRFQTSRRGR